MIKVAAVVFGSMFAANALGTVVYYLVHKRQSS